jgi:hypothetical protein
MYNFGDKVSVLDFHKRSEIMRGKVVGINRMQPTHYDVQPDNEPSCSKRMCSIPEARLRGNH